LRVAVVDGTKLAEYDYESKVRKQLKGSIFLAKVTRVEPSLQAAFVNFGGNRHGFLPFNEIHPDYFRIPIADREALIAAQQAELDAQRAEEEAEDEAQSAEGGQNAEQGEPVSEEGEEQTETIEEIGGEDRVATDDEEIEEKAATAKQEEENSENAEQSSAAFESTGTAPEESSEHGHEYEHEHDHEQDSQGNSSEEESAGNTAEGQESASAQEGEQDGAPQGEQGQGEGQENRHSGGRGRYRGRGRGGRGGPMQARSRRFEKRGDDEGDGPRIPGRRHYKIQEVIKRGQIMLVQVSREERGNKGAAVTTYLSLPGRYCVLMPNSHRAGGVSRKVASFQERRRMREMLSELTVPNGMSVIMRTAGVSRTKPEIKRDLDYLTKLWDGIRDLTLKSTAPALVHEEGQLIRRAIRDIYTREVEEIFVAGEEGYKVAKDFMKMMIPSHIKRVQQYTDEKTPLFQRYQVENQITQMGEPSVTLRSGGTLVISPTEALVSIDVNSGKATRERHIEETALKTNLEAAEEVARQLRLRDLGGLIVIDFIDMEDRRNNRKVENRLRDALSTDRARIQMGRISSFGLLEMSRQRLNPSLTEAQFEKCPHCKGIGVVRTVDMTAVTALRALEEEGQRSRAVEVALHIPDTVALYILNNKRAMLSDIERRYGFHVMIHADEALAPAGFRVEPLRSGSSGHADDDESGEGGIEESSSATVGGESEAGGNSNGGQRNHDRNERGGRRRGGRGRGGYGRDRNERNYGSGSDAGHSHHHANTGGNDQPLPDEHGNVPEEVEDIADDVGNRRPDGESEPNGNNARGEGPVGEGGRRRRRRGGRGRGRNRDRNGSGVYGQAQGEPRRDREENGNMRGPRENVNEPSSFQPRPSSQQDSRNEFRDMPVAESVAPAPSNDVERTPAAPRERDYERVNEEPTNKKKGWWNKLTE
ncbi:MAG TPA: Rne/Rng family ribonuclease, partial [Alphaproteobacteria bacterium]